jgi:hypothetical protein
MKEKFEDTKEVIGIHKSKKGQETNYKMTNTDQQKSSPISALSVIGVRQYEMVQMSRILFFYFQLSY